MSQTRVAYLVSQYPALTHTFIAQEIAALREQGVVVETFSIRPAPESELISPEMKAEAARTESILGRSKQQILAAQATLAKKAPAVYAKLFGGALRTGIATPKGRVWQTFYAAEAVVLWSLMAERGLRHVHVHMGNVSADVARMAVQIGRAVDGPDAGWGWSLTIHGPGEFEMVEQWDVPDKLRSAKAVAPISDFARSQLMRLVETEHWGKMHVVHMTVDTDHFAPPAGDRLDRSGPLRILAVGRLVPQKGWPILMDALKQLHEQGVDFEFRAAGSGPLDAELERTAREYGIADRVTFLGPVGPDVMPAQYAWADVFTLPSFQEGLPVVLMEAMATQLPVVTTQIAAMSELIVHGEMGHVLPAGRADLVAAALLDERDRGPQGRLEQGRKGRQAVLDGFTARTEGPKMARFLADASR